MAKAKPTTSNTSTFTNDPSGFYSGFTTQNLHQLGSGPAGWSKANDEPSSNLPFDPRIARKWTFNQKTGDQTSGGFTPGVRVNSGAMSTIGPNGQMFTTYFQFNPTEIDIAYGFDDSVIGALNPVYLDPTDQSTASQGLMLNQSVSFSLLFDRTYEVWTGPAAAPTTLAGQQLSSQQGISGLPNVPGAGPNGSSVTAGGNNFQDPLGGRGPYMFGAQWDVWSVERLVGIYGQWKGQGPSGPPASSLIYVQFSPMNLSLASSMPGFNGDFGAGSTQSYAPAFAGWMTSLEATYTRFDAGMVPTRAAVSVTFEQIYSLSAQSSPNPPPTPSASGP